MKYGRNFEQIEKDVKALKNKYSGNFLWGVIGGSIIDDETTEFCQDLGYAIREKVQELGKGYIFTGGVGGVGVSIHQGIREWHADNPEQEIRDFKVLYHVENKKNGEKRKQDPKEDIPPIEPVGYNMADRRLGITKLGTVIFAVAGGPGTQDELKCCLENSTPLVLCYGFGGYTDILADAKEFLSEDKQKRINIVYIDERFPDDNIVDALKIAEGYSIVNRGD